MMNNISIRNNPVSPVLNPEKGNSAVQNNKTSFGDMLTNAVSEINKLQMDADEAIARVELSDSGSIHEAMIALEEANISFRAMMQVRNKVLEAYQEVMRMQV